MERSYRRKNQIWGVWVVWEACQEVCLGVCQVLAVWVGIWTLKRLVILNLNLPQPLTTLLQMMAQMGGPGGAGPSGSSGVDDDDFDSDDDGPPPLEEK